MKQFLLALLPMVFGDEFCEASLRDETASVGLLQLGIQHHTLPRSESGVEPEHHKPRPEPEPEPAAPAVPAPSRHWPRATAAAGPPRRTGGRSLLETRAHGTVEERDAALRGGDTSAEARTGRGGSSVLETHHEFADDNVTAEKLVGRDSKAKSGQGDEARGREEEHSPILFLWLGLAMILVPVLFWACSASRVVQVFALYVALYMLWSMLTYATRDNVHSSAMVVLNALLIKLVISAVLWRIMDGPFSELPLAAWQDRATLNQYVVPAGLYALGDALRVDALRATDPGTFAILFNSRVPFLIFAWQYAMGRSLKAIHWVSLLAILAGCMVKEMPHAKSDPNQERWLAYGEIVLLGVFTATAAVWNEMLLQKRAHVSVNLQNCAMYIWGIFWTFLLTVAWWVLVPSAANPFDVDSWIIIWSNPLILAGVIVLALYGVTTAYFLRYLTNIAREVALGVFAALSVAMDRLVFGERLVALEYAGAALVLTGIALFAYEPMVAAPLTTKRQMPEVPEAACSSNVDI